MVEDVFTVRLYCLDRDEYISDTAALPVAYKDPPSLLSLYYTETTVLRLKPTARSGGVALCYRKNSLPFWFQRLPHDIYPEDIVHRACQEGQMLFEDVS